MFLDIALDEMHSSAVLSLLMFFFVESQVELVRVTSEASRHRDPQQAVPQQLQDFFRRILWAGTFCLRVLVELTFVR